MVWTSRWAVIGCMALAQLGMMVGYQALLTGETGRVEAEAPGGPQTVPPPNVGPELWPVEVPAAPPQAPALMPSIPVPVLPPPPDNPVPAPLPLGLSSAAQPIPNLPLPQEQAPAAALPAPLIPVGAQAIAPPDTPLQAPPMPGVLSNITPITPPATKPDVKPGPTCPWSLNVQIIDGRTHLTAQNGKDVTFTVSCEKLEVQTPGGFIHAEGKVKLTTDNLEGACDRMVIAWQQDVVVLDKAKLTCKLEGHEAELQADQLRLRLSRLVSVREAGQALKYYISKFP